MDVQKVPQGLGSGFIWDLQGHIVTNYHVRTCLAEQADLSGTTHCFLFAVCCVMGSIASCVALAAEGWSPTADPVTKMFKGRMRVPTLHIASPAIVIQCACATGDMLVLLQVIKGAVEVQVALIDQSVYSATVSQPLHSASTGCE